MSQEEQVDALKIYKRKLNKIKRDSIAELKSDVASNLTDSMELLNSIKAVTKSSYGEPYLVQYQFAKQGLFQQLGVSGQFGQIGGAITSKTGMKPTKWFDPIYDKHKNSIESISTDYYAAKVVSEIDFQTSKSRR